MNIEEFRPKAAALLASIAEHIEADFTVAMARIEELAHHVIDFHDQMPTLESLDTSSTVPTGSGAAPSASGEGSADAIEQAQAAVKVAEDAILNAGVDADQDKLAADLKAAEDAMALLLPAS